MTEPPESRSPTPPSAAPRRLGGLWRRGRLALLILGGLGVGHWYRARTSATETAALLHGSVGQFGACVVGGRPPDPLNPDAARTLEAMLFRRLALSLESAKPLADCAALAQQVQERVAAHRGNFYHRSPAATSELESIAQRLTALEYSEPALALSKKPEAGAPGSTTQQLLRDLGRALVLSCDIAQAEKAYAVGACPVPGAASGAAKSAPRVALDVSLGEPVTDFSMTQGASPSEPRVLISAVGRRGGVSSWVAGQVKSDLAHAWRTLAVPPPSPPAGAPPPPASARGLPALGASAGQHPRGLDLVASGGGSWLVEASLGGPRLFALDPGLTSANLQFHAPSDAAPASAWIGAALVPLGPDLTVVPEAAAGETHLTWRSRAGDKLRTVTLKGQLLAVLLSPPRLLLAEPAGDTETTLSVWNLAEGGASQAAQLNVSDFTGPPGSANAEPVSGASPSILATCRSQGDDVLLAQGATHNWLLRLPADANQPSVRAWPALATESLHLGCGPCAPYVLRAVERQLTLLDWDALAPKQRNRTAPSNQVETPVMFSTSAALRSTTACGPQARLVAYSVGGAVLTQRVSEDGATSAPLEVAGPGDQGQATTPWMINQAGRLLLFWRRSGGATRSDRLKLEVAESRDGGQTWR